MKRFAGWTIPGTREKITKRPVFARNPPSLRWATRRAGMGFRSTHPRPRDKFMSSKAKNVAPAGEARPASGSLGRSIRAFAAFAKVVALRLPAKTPDEWAAVGEQLIRAIDAHDDSVAAVLLKRHGPQFAKEAFGSRGPRSALALCASRGLSESTRVLLPLSDPLATHEDNFDAHKAVWPEVCPSTALFEAIAGRNIEVLRMIAPISDLLHERGPGLSVFWRASALLQGWSAVDNIVSGPMFIALMDESLRRPPASQSRLFQSALKEIREGLADVNGVTNGTRKNIEKHNLVEAFVERVPSELLESIFANQDPRFPLPPELRAPLAAKHEAWALAQVVAKASEGKTGQNGEPEAPNRVKAPRKAARL